MVLLLHLGGKHCLSPMGIESEMTRICFEFLCPREMEQSEYDYIDINHFEDDGTYDLEVYSAEHWPHHFREAQYSTKDLLIPELFQLYDTHSDLYELWSYHFWQATDLYDDVPQINKIQLIAALGHETILKLLLEQDTPPWI